METAEYETQQKREKQALWPK